MPAVARPPCRTINELIYQTPVAHTLGIRQIGACNAWVVHSIRSLCRTADHRTEMRGSTLPGALINGPWTVDRGPCALETLESD